MGCYTVPATAAIIHFFLRKKYSLNDRYHKMLNFLFLGGAIFGVVDHIWNGDLLAFSLSDVLLGVVITFVMWMTGLVIMLADKKGWKVKNLELS